MCFSALGSIERHSQLQHNIGLSLSQYWARYRVVDFSLYWIVRLKIVQCLQRTISHHSPRGARKALIISNQALTDARRKSNDYFNPNSNTKINSLLTKLVEEMDNAAGGGGMNQAL